MHHRIHKPICLLTAVLILGIPHLAPAAASRSPSQPGSEITLNLKGADIRQVAQMVSAITGKNFIIDPRAQGRVTVISAKPISASALFSVFQSVLQVHGLAAMPAGHNTWKIVPSIEGRQMPGVPGPHRSRAADDAMVTEVVQLKNVQVSRLVPALRPLMSSYAQLAAYPPSNMLVISDRAGNVRRIARLAHELDRPSNANFDLIHLKHASAVNVAQILANMLRGPAFQGQMPLKLAADPRTNSILITGSPAERLEVQALVTQLDSPTGSQGNTQVIYLHYAQAVSLAKVLQSFIKSQKQPSGGKGQVTANRISTNLVADKGLNALIVTATPKVMAELKNIIHALDVRRAQVLVQGIIAVLSSATAAQLGITWAAESSGVAGLTNFPNGVVNLGSLANAGGSGTAGALGAAAGNLASQIPGGLLFGVGRLIKNGTSFAALLNALSSDSSANILSTPSLVTLNNQKAELISGQNVPLVTGQYTNTGTGTATTGINNLINPFQTVQRKQLGLSLKIKPQINYGGNTVTLSINVTDQSLAPSVQGASGLVTSKREIKTTIVARNKQIVVLGGLISTNLSQSRQKVPLLGDIPLIGNLFRYRSSKKQRQNLMIFLRPVILRNTADTNAATSPRYNQIREMEIGRGEHIPLLPGVKPPVLPRLVPPSESRNLPRAAPVPQSAPAAGTASRPGATTNSHGHGN